MIFKKEKWLQCITAEHKRILMRLYGGVLDAHFLWWNKFDGAKVYPDKDVPGFYTDETAKYLFKAEWCEEEGEEK